MPLCQCLTSKNQPCKNPTKKDSMYCASHQNCKKPKKSEPEPKSNKKEPEPEIGDQLIEATAKNNVGQVSQILNQSKLPQDYFIQVAMSEASREGFLPIVIEILKVMGKIKDKEDILDAGLYEATTKGNLPIMVQLIKGGAVPQKALFAATSNNQEQAVQLLVSSGAKINDNEAIRGAIHGGHLAILKKIVKMGADIKTNINKWLVTASIMDQIGIVEYLIQNGANTADPATLKQILSDDQDHSAVLQLFVINEAMFGKKGNGDHVKFLLQKSHPTKKNLDDILSAVAENSSTDRSDIIKILVKAGADPESVDVSKIKSDVNKVVIQFASYLDT